MKKYLLLGLTCFVIMAPAAFARIIRVNNTGISCLNPADCYTSVAAAITAASAGDTVHIEPSGTSYGNFTVNKGIVLLGNGYFLGNSAANGNDGLQVNTATSFCGNITVSADADGAVLKGLNINILSLIGANAGNPLNNVVVMRNRLVNGGGTSWTNNLMFIGNYVGGTLNTGFNSTGNNANFYIGNNVLWSCEFDNVDNGTFENNIIYGGSQPNTVVMYNATVQNNISTAQNTHTFSNCTVRNNVARGSTATTSYGTLNGNKNNIDPATVFADFANSSASYSTDSRWQLVNGSPASGAGFGGTDCGIFGGSNLSYKLSGLPDIPSIYRLTVPASAGGSTMNIIFSTRINN